VWSEKPSAGAFEVAVGPFARSELFADDK
jgi:hypothetical protein